MTIVRVLKPFVFSFPLSPAFPSAPGSRTAEQSFTPGDVELPDDHPLFSHPWFSNGFCDGHVEMPATESTPQLLE